MSQRQSTGCWCALAWTAGPALSEAACGGDNGCDGLADGDAFSSWRRSMAAPAWGSGRLPCRAARVCSRAADCGEISPDFVSEERAHPKPDAL